MWRRRFTYDGHRFALRRGVFDPKRHLSGVAFADQLDDALHELLPVGPARARVFDLGTGSGILAWQAASLGASVVATDVSAAAVRSAAKNCAGLDVEVRRGDLFDPVWGEWFDVVMVNPPYEVDDAATDAELALASPDFLQRFGAEVGEYTDRVLLGFPADDEATLALTGLEFDLWRRVRTAGDDLGLFVWSARAH